MSDDQNAERPHPLSPIVIWDEAKRTLTIDGMPISVSVLSAIVDTDKRVLWRFGREGKVIKATYYTEDHVIWLDRPNELEV